MWYKGSDGTDVSTADLAVCKSSNGAEERVVATGDDRGIVSLYRAPALEVKERRMVDTRADVTSVRFTRDAANMFSAGGDSACCSGRSPPPD